METQKRESTTSEILRDLFILQLLCPVTKEPNLGNQLFAVYCLDKSTTFNLRANPAKLLKAHSKTREEINKKYIIYEFRIPTLAEIQQIH